MKLYGGDCKPCSENDIPQSLRRKWSGNKTINEIASEMGIHATQITQWKKQAQEGLKEVFADRRGKSQSQEPLIEHLYQNIGRLQVELEWLQKNLVLPLESKQELIEPTNREISIVRQCELLGLNRSSQGKLT